MAIPIGVVNWPLPEPNVPKLLKNTPAGLSIWILSLPVSAT